VEETVILGIVFITLNLTNYSGIEKASIFFKKVLLITKENFSLWREIKEGGILNTCSCFFLIDILVPNNR
jgi:hypothetical protein